MKKKTLLPALTLAAGLALPGCGSEQAPAPAPAGATTAETTPPAATSAAQQAARLTCKAAFPNDPTVWRQTPPEIAKDPRSQEHMRTDYQEAGSFIGYVSCTQAFTSEEKRFDLRFALVGVTEAPAIAADAAAGDCYAMGVAEDTPVDQPTAAVICIPEPLIMARTAQPN